MVYRSVRSALPVQESPIKQALQLRMSPQFARCSRNVQQHLVRLADRTKVSSDMVKILDEEGVALRVCRWVAWGKWQQDRVLRLGMVMWLRREPDLNAPGRRSACGWVWPEIHILTATEKQVHLHPNFKQLERVGFRNDGKSPDPIANTGMLVSNWRRTWETVQQTLDSIDKTLLLAQAERIAATRKKRLVRKRLKLSPEENEYVLALRTLQRGVLRGEIKLNEVSPLTK